MGANGHLQGGFQVGCADPRRVDRHGQEAGDGDGCGDIEGGREEQHEVRVAFLVHALALPNPFLYPQWLIAKR